jgi:threonylcarbamoyladenosine tRNA methylthiotransferase MtaB
VTTFSVRFLGCKVSHVDGHAVRERLLGDGHEERDGGADVAVVNTCCVTHEAVAKSRKEAARAARTHRRVYVTGCGANLAGDAFAGLPDNVVVVARRSEETPEFVAGDVGAIGCLQADARLDRVRAFVKVQDGCSFSCRFCVIPLVRGTSRSRPAEAVLGEIRRRVAQGHREVVLTGINLGCYRDRVAGYRLPRLVRDAGATPGLERLRLSSIEINHVDDELVRALRDPDREPSPARAAPVG